MRNARAIVRAIVVAVGLLAGLAAAQDAPANIKTVTPDELRTALAAHEGKVRVINVWATWCGPCRVEFPHLVKLYNTYKDKGVVVIAVSIDRPSDLDAVRAFVTEMKAEMPVFTSRAPELRDYVQAVDPEFAGGVPVTYILDRKGERVVRPLLSKQKYETFVRFVEQALAAE